MRCTYKYTVTGFCELREKSKKIKGKLSHFEMKGKLHENKPRCYIVYTYIQHSIQFLVKANNNCTDTRKFTDHIIIVKV